LAFAIHPDDSLIDPSVSCGKCDAVCCRLTVVLVPGDIVPDQFVEHGPKGIDTMARGADGWCAALDHEHMCCGIYEQRPAICRKFAMGGGYCRHEREKYRLASARNIPLRVC
jgi:Fe-S-cluster containining protein